MMYTVEPSHKNVGPQIAYVIHIDQSDLIDSKQCNQVHRDFHTPYVNKMCSSRHRTWLAADVIQRIEL